MELFTKQWNLPVRLSVNCRWLTGFLWLIWPLRPGLKTAFSLLTQLPKNTSKKERTDAVYSDIIEIDARKIEPQVAFPHLPSNVRGISKAGKVKIDQSLIGSCTNGRIEDLRIAAQILKNRKAASNVRLIVVPATPFIYKQALQEGLLEIFLNAGAVISPPSCGACLGGHLGILAEGERAIATTNRNFVGRMGHPKSEVYLASPAVAAASAVLGRIASPAEL